MQNRHPYADILIAIAEGKTVEWRIKNSQNCNEWYDFNPSFHQFPGSNLSSNVEWRVKPEVKTKEVWVNVYPRDRFNLHDFKSTADNHAGPNRIACVKVKIEYYEGQGLD